MRHHSTNEGGGLLIRVEPLEERGPTSSARRWCQRVLLSDGALKLGVDPTYGAAIMRSV